MNELDLLEEVRALRAENKRLKEKLERANSKLLAICNRLGTIDNDIPNGRVE